MEEKTLPELPAEKPRKDWLKIIVFSLVGIIILSSIFYIGYWYGVNQSATEAPKSAIPTPTLTVLSTPTPTPVVKDEIFGWKTYRNEKYGYLIKYPDDWEKVSEEEEKRRGLPETHDSIELKLEDICKPILDVETITDYKLSLEEFIQERKDGRYYEKIYSEEEILIDGIRGYEIVALAVREWNPYIIAKDIFFIKNNMFYTLSFEDWCIEKLEQSKSQQIFNQILSTFKFLD